MRLLFIVLSILSLLTAILGGLVRAGSSAAPVIPAAVIFHGPLMVSVFFGSLIGIERAVALQRPWPWSSPLLSLISGMLLLAGSPWYHLAAFAAAAVFLAAGIAGYKRAPQLPLLVMAIASLFWLAGNAVAYFGGIPAALPSWIAFLAITIAGERLEFSKLRRSAPHEIRLFFASVSVLALSSALSLPLPYPAHAALGFGLLSLGLWLLSFDIARQSVKRPGSARFIGLTLLLGYFWLAASGAIVLSTAPAQGGFTYDAWVHAFFLGFVFSMVFGHGPVIFPALIRRPFSFSAILYLPVTLLNVTLGARVLGDLIQSPSLRLSGAWGNAVALLSFFAAIFFCLIRQATGASGAEQPR